MIKKLRTRMYISLLFQTCLMVTNCIITSFALVSPIMPNMDELNRIAYKGRPLHPCAACVNLVKSFLNAVEETARKGFSGGDADWERQKLGNYENSELRFIEIQEMLCSEVEHGKDQCYTLAEEHESELEDWFYEKRKNNVDLHESLCINNLKVCCPNNTYGPKCVPCPGGIEKPCGGRGRCMKGGTREEPASCLCDDGYAGELCNECDKEYYQELDSAVLSCKKCDRACKGHCRGPGPKSCEVCANGFHFVPNEGCIEKIENGDEDEMQGEMNGTEKDLSHSEESTDKNEDVHLDTNFKDSSVDEPHSEL